MAKIPAPDFRRLLTSLRHRKGLVEAFNEPVGGAKAADTIAATMESMSDALTQSVKSTGSSLLPNGYWEYWPTANDPPPPLVVTAGVWGTDMEREFSENFTETGQYSIKFNDTGVSSTLEWGLIPVAEADTFDLFLRYKQTGSLNRDLTFTVVEYDYTKTAIIATAFSTPTLALNTWTDFGTTHTMAGGSSTRFVRISFNANSQAGTVYVDRVTLIPPAAAPSSSVSTNREGFSVVMSAGQTLDTGVTANVHFDQVIYDVGSNFVVYSAGSGGYFLAPRDGYYRFTGAVTLTGHPNLYLHLFLRNDDTGYTRRLARIESGAEDNIAGGTRIFCNAGDKVYLRVQYGDGAAATRDIDTSNTVTWFEGAMDD